MKRYIPIGLFLLGPLYLFTQNQSDTIEVRKTFFGTTFRLNGRNLKPRELLDITKVNAEAYKEMKIAHKNFVIANIFGMPGGFLVGWPIGTAIGGGQPNWSLAAMGAGLIVIEIPFATAYVRHAKMAVRIYNANSIPKNTAPANNIAVAPKSEMSTADLASVLYFTGLDSSYQNYITRIKLLLSQDKKINSYKFCEYKYGNGQVKNRGIEAKHTYGVNDEYSYKIGTWEYYSRQGVLEKVVNYDLRENIVVR